MDEIEMCGPAWVVDGGGCAGGCAGLSGQSIGREDKRAAAV